MDQLFAVSVQGLQQGRCEAARGAEAGSGGNIGHRGDFERARFGPTSLKASRIIGCLRSSILPTRSSSEYLTIRSSMNVWWTVIYTYRSIAAAIRKPVLSR